MVQRKKNLTALLSALIARKECGSGPTEKVIFVAHMADMGMKNVLPMQ
nr:hypothetical protein [Peribacillus sp. TH27]